MIAALCILIPSLIAVFIKERLFQKQNKSSRILLQYFAYVLIINGLIMLFLLLFYTNGNHLIDNLNHQPAFAVKYAALALLLAVTVPFVEKGMKKIRKISIFLRILFFILIFAVGFGVVNFILQPDYNTNDEGHNYDMTKGFYREPKNTIETLFLGSSHVRCAVSPMMLYEEDGICAYNISTNSQPILASFYWLEEVYHSHSETLDTVVLDVSSLRNDPIISHYHEALDPMRFSSIKVRAVKAYSSDFTEFIENLIPVFSYHDRWEELKEEDFIKFENEPKNYMRGYDFITNQWINNATNYSDVSLPLLFSEENSDPVELDETALVYFNEIASFCYENDIQLVLIKIPTSWSAEDHDAIQELADAYGLDFIDFNVEPFYSDIGMDLAADVLNPSDTNNLHLNYYGAVKITDYLGNYLIEECGNKDVRGEEKYAFMDEELEDYNRYIIKARLGEIEDPAEYLAYLMDREDYEIFISSKGDSSASLSEEQREYFASIGLEKLASLESRDSYLAVIDNGDVVTEELNRYDEALDTSGDSEKITATMAVTTEGVLENGTSYSLSSCGGLTVSNSSCILDGTEQSPNTRGLNFVVYDKKLSRVADTVAFDTYASDTRKPVSVEQALSQDLDNGAEYEDLSDNEKKLYRYDMLCNTEMAEKTSGEDGFLNYLSYFWDNEDYTIFISAKTDAAKALNEDVRFHLASMGLEELSQLERRDSYIAIASGGEILEEVRDHGESPIEVDGGIYTITSGGRNSGDLSSIVIKGIERSLNSRGLNIVIYNNLDASIMSSVTFDTHKITPAIPEELAP